MSDDRLKLKPFNELAAEELGRRLHELVRTDFIRIGKNFPAVTERYGSPDQAVESVRQWQTPIEKEFHPFVVTYNGVTIGEVILRQACLRHGLWPFRKTRAEGTQLAFWAGHTIDRAVAPWPLTPHLLPLIEAQIVILGLARSRWTLIQPRRAYTIQSLKGRGFLQKGLPHRYHIGDAVTEPRLLFVAGE